MRIKLLFIIFILFNLVNNFSLAINFSDSLRFSKFGSDIYLNNMLNSSFCLKNFECTFDMKRIEQGNTLQYFNTINNDINFEISKYLDKKQNLKVGFNYIYDLIYYNNLSSDINSNFKKVNTATTSNTFNVFSEYYFLNSSIYYGVGKIFKFYDTNKKDDKSDFDRKKEAYFNVIHFKNKFNNENLFNNNLDFTTKILKNEYFLAGYINQQLKINKNISLEFNYNIDKKKNYYIQIDKYKEEENDTYDFNFIYNNNFFKYYLNPFFKKNYRYNRNPTDYFDKKLFAGIYNKLTIGKEEKYIEFDLKLRNAKEKYKNNIKDKTIKDNFFQTFVYYNFLQKYSISLLYNINLQSHYYKNILNFEDLDNMLTSYGSKLNYKHSENFLLSLDLSYINDKLFYIKKYYSIYNREKKLYSLSTSYEYKINDNCGFKQKGTIDANYIHFVYNKKNDTFFRNSSIISDFYHDFLNIEYKFIISDYGKFLNNIYYKEVTIYNHEISISDTINIKYPFIKFCNKYAYQRGSEYNKNNKINSFFANIFYVDLNYKYSNYMEININIEAKFLNKNNRAITGFSEIVFKY